MSNELEPGCLAIVIDSVEGLAIGKTVQCLYIDGEHSQYGTVWMVHCKEQLGTEFGGVGNKVHIPAIWLKKILPPELPEKTKIVEKDLVKNL